MGYAGKLKEKRMALKLRRQGLSYGEILNKVNVSKATLSLWCRDVVLSYRQLERLERRKLEGAEKGRIIGAKMQQRKRIIETERLFNQGKKEVGSLGNRDIFIAGIGLYMGDGSKGDKEVGFSNSNPNIIIFMMSWFRKFCEVPENKFRGRIWIHDNLDEVVAKKYWSKLTEIPPNQFIKSYVVKNKTKSRKIRKQLHPYGVFAIKISSCNVQRRIHGWMYGVLGKPVVQLASNVNIPR